MPADGVPGGYAANSLGGMNQWYKDITTGKISSTTDVREEAVDCGEWANDSGAALIFDCGESYAGQRANRKAHGTVLKLRGVIHDDKLPKMGVDIPKPPPSWSLRFT